MNIGTWNSQFGDRDVDRFAVKVADNGVVTLLMSSHSRVGKPSRVSVTLNPGDLDKLIAAIEKAKERDGTSINFTFNKQ